MNAKLSLNHPQAHPVSRASRAWALSLLITVTCLLASPARAILVTWTNAATGVWTNPVVWNPNGAPVATNDYLVSGAFTMQSVDTNTSIFNANSVTVQSGSTLYFYRSNGGTSLSTTNIFTNTVAATASTLTVSNAIIKLDSSLGSVLHHLKTPLLLKGTNTITYGTTDGYTLDLYLDSPLTGSGSVNLTRSTSGTSHQRDFYLTGDSSGYSGSWTNTGTAAGTTSGTLNFYSTAVSGWGSGNMTLNAFANLTISAAITNPAPRITLNSSSATLTVNSASVIGSLSGVASSTATEHQPIIRALFICVRSAIFRLCMKLGMMKARRSVMNERSMNMPTVRLRGPRAAVPTGATISSVADSVACTNSRPDSATTFVSATASTM